MLPPPLCTILPYTTLFRSLGAKLDAGDEGNGREDQQGAGAFSGPIARQSGGLKRAVGVDPGDDRQSIADLVEGDGNDPRSEEHTSELQSQSNLVCRLLLEK